MVKLTKQYTKKCEKIGGKQVEHLIEYQDMQDGYAPHIIHKNCSGYKELLCNDIKNCDLMKQYI